jgi:hypothetical protein
VLLAFARELRGSVTTTVDEQGNDRLTECSRGLLDAAERLEHLLEDLAQQPRRHA